MLEKEERKELDREWIQIVIIWGSLFSSLAIYVFICIVIDKGGNISKQVNSQIDTIRMALYFISLAILFLAKFIRKKMLSTKDEDVNKMFSKDISNNRHPAIAKYTIAIIVSTAMVEIIGIFGVVLFFLGEGLETLYSFIMVSAAAMLYFRPQKEELLKLANQMK